MTIWTEAYAALQAASRVVIVTHPRPDGDAIGSLLGLGNQIRTMGKDVTCAVDGGVPPYMMFLPGTETVVSTLTEGDWDLLITTDIADTTRGGDAGNYAQAHAGTIINIDHHPTNPGFGDFVLLNPNAVSAAEVVYDWWEATGQTYGREVAMPLLTGMVTDSLGFRISSTKPRTLEIAISLMERGASLTEITARTLDTRSAQEFELWKRVLPGAVREHEIAHASVTLSDAATVGFNDSTDAGLVQFLVNINEVMIAAIFKERSLGEIGISLRSKRGYDVASVAAALGGGGHIQASGATVQGSLDEVRARVLPLLHEAARKGKLEIV